MVVLKRLSDAQADGDRILAVIRGSAVNQDGPSSGLTVPNGPAQQAVIRRALAAAGLQPEEIDYVEAHGTGTALGDPIEMGAIGAVFGGAARAAVGRLGEDATSDTWRRRPGIAGLIKVVLALEHEEIPPHLHFRQPSPHIPWDALPREGSHRSACRGRAASAARGRGELVRLQRHQRPRGGGGGARRPCVLAGPDPSHGEQDRICHLVAFRPRRPARAWTNWRLVMPSTWRHPAASLADVSFTTTMPAGHTSRQRPCSRDRRTEAGGRLEAVAQRREPAGGLPRPGRGASPASWPSSCSRAGAPQYAGMGRELYEHEPVFRAAMDRCETAAARRSGPALDRGAFEPPRRRAGADRLHAARHVRPGVRPGRDCGSRGGCAAGVAGGP